MSSTLFEAPAYDPRRERRRRIVVIAVLVVAAVMAVLAYRYRNWPEERVVNRFFHALQQKDYEGAYATWMHDPAWKQHPQQYGQYPYEDFYRDWGPGGEWGVISSYKLIGSERPKGGSGVVVLVEVNQRAEKARLWVEKRDKTLTFSPF